MGVWDSLSKKGRGSRTTPSATSPRPHRNKIEGSTHTPSVEFVHLSRNKYIIVIRGCGGPQLSNGLAKACTRHQYSNSERKNAKWTTYKVGI